MGVAGGTSGQGQDQTTVGSLVKLKLNGGSVSEGSSRNAERDLSGSCRDGLGLGLRLNESLEESFGQLEGKCLCVADRTGWQGEGCGTSRQAEGEGLGVTSSSGG